VWGVFEEFVDAGKVRFIGLSNTYDIETLRTVHDKARIKPAFLQNRFYADTSYDVQIRKFCDENGILYQSFWTLTGNRNLLKSPVVTSLAEKLGKTKEQVFYRFVQHLGLIPLSGTTSEAHMADDLALGTFELEAADIENVKKLLSAAQHK